MQYVSSPTSITCIVSPLVLLDSASALGVSSVHRRFFKRIKGAEWTSPDLLERKGWITGIVTRCVSIRRRFFPPPVPEQSTGAQLRIEWVMRTTSISTIRQVLVGEDHSNFGMYLPTKKVRKHQTKLPLLAF